MQHGELEEVALTGEMRPKILLCPRFSEWVQIFGIWQSLLKLKVDHNILSWELGAGKRNKRHLKTNFCKSLLPKI